jgi:thioredoxin-related protein
MNRLFFLFLIPILPINNWLKDLDIARQKAREEHKFILLNFSGSDWCAPCIRMHREIFDNAVFQKMAEKKLILVNADFPRSKKNQLSPDQQKKNESMAEQYNQKGNFPYTILMDENGKVLRTWEGFYSQGAEAFTELVENLTAHN